MSKSARRNLKTKIARIIFAQMSDIDGDIADWLHFREDLEAAAQEIIDTYINPTKMKKSA